MLELPYQKQKVRAAIALIVDKILAQGREGLSFWGLKNDSNYHLEPGGYTKDNIGNLAEFLQFHVRGGDVHLKKYLNKKLVCIV